MVKKNTFKDKPRPPNREQIIADFGTASSDDIVFQHTFHTGLPSDTSTDKIKEEHAKSQSLGQNAQVEDTSNPDREKINQTYEQVTKLIQLHTQLMREPQLLDEKYEHLEKLEQDVSDSITELKSAAESVINKVVK